MKALESGVTLISPLFKKRFDSEGNKSPDEATEHRRALTPRRCRAQQESL